MRILQVSSAHSLGGGETHVIELREKLRQLGHEVLLTGRSNGPLNPDFALPFRNSADFISALRLRQFVLQHNVDVVHAHVARDYPVVAAAAWRVPKLKVIFTRHLLHPVRRHALYRRVDGWIAPTKEIANTLAPLKPRRVAVIPNWVDVAKLQFAPHEIHSPVTIGLLGQVSPHKGHEDAIETLRFLGDGFRLIIAGDGKADYLATLRKRAAGLRVDFAGFVSPPELFRQIDILILPSWHEPFGLVLLEAMASGIPVIATACGGPLDIIESGVHGLLIPPRNYMEMAAAIRRLVESADLRHDIVLRARARVESDFEIQKLVPRIEQFYID